MNTNLIFKGNALQECFLEYFKINAHEAQILNQSGISGTLEIKIHGRLAKLFESISTPIPKEPHKRILRVIFDRDIANIISGYELIAPGSPILKVIANEMSNNSLYTRSAINLNLENNAEDLEAFHILIWYMPSKRTNCKYSFCTYYLFRYLIRQKSYETNEDILPILVNSENMEILSSSVVAKLKNVNLIDISTVCYQDEVSYLSKPDIKKIQQCLIKSEDDIRIKVENFLQERAAELALQLEKEKKIIKKHYSKEKEKASQARKIELEDLERKKIEESEQRYNVKFDITLQSIQEIVIPKVEYQPVSIVNKKEILIPKIFYFDSLENLIATEPCSQCGQQKEWAYCTDGNHLCCLHCGKVQKCNEDHCSVGMCPQHIIYCEKCMTAICTTHQNSCRYCNSNRKYCNKHIEKSFEGQNICDVCANSCPQCLRLFPLYHLRDCSICKKKFCYNDIMTCPSCKNFYCQSDGKIPQGYKKAYCLNCLGQCDECTQDITYRKTELKTCKVCKKKLCSNHELSCVSCKKTFCSQHTFKTPYGLGCADCFDSCTSCQKIEYLQKLSSCHICATQENRKKLYCSQHIKNCPTCRNLTCINHFVKLKDGSNVCTTCAKSCSICQELFLRKDLKSCSTCNSLLCSQHSIHSEFREEIYCKNHTQNFRECPGCSRKGPYPQLVKCSCCGINYCPHCIDYSQGTHCSYCRNLSVLTESSRSMIKNWVEIVRIYGYPQYFESAKVKQEMLAALSSSDQDYEISFNQNNSFIIIYGQYRGGFWGFISKFFRNVKNFVLVGNKKDASIENIKVNI